MMRQSTKMETLKFIVLLILYCICATFEYPSRPLNERSPDLTWQAWLLVDDQNQNQNKQTNADGILRRRITPKSVFIAPTFSPESLPACADGYSSDPMGRCVKIIKLDQDAHYEFLIEKLKQKFESFDYEDEEEEIVQPQPTAGPFQVNIPLNIDGDDLRAEESDQDTDVAIIVSPTKPDFDFKTLNLGKRDSVIDEMEQEQLLKKLAETTTRKHRDSTTTQQISTTSMENEQTSTISAEIQTLASGTMLIPVEELESTAVTDPTKSEITSTDAVDFTTEDLSTLSTMEAIVTQSPKPFEDLQTETVLKHHKPEITTLSPKPELTTYNHLIRFPVEPKVDTLLNTYVRFPSGSDISYQTQIPASVDHITSVRDAGAFRKKTEKPIVFPEQEVASLDYTNGVHSHQAHQIDLNRRNRDKHNSLFLIPPRWNPSGFQKPLVLRFSRKHAFMDTDQFKNPDYYRSIPTDDFAYLFKFKHKPPVHRR